MVHGWWVVDGRLVNGKRVVGGYGGWWVVDGRLVNGKRVVSGG